jgi:transcriptional regulator with XRE-family HTH domain
MIRVKLKESMETYRLRTGQRITYADLAKMSGVAEGTLNSIGSRLGYQPNLATVERIARALQMPFQELLEQIPDPPRPKRAAGRKRGGG